MITVVVLVYETTTYLFQRISRLFDQYTEWTETATSVVIDVPTPETDQSVVDVTTDLQSELPVSVTESTSETEVSFSECTSDSQPKLPVDDSTSVLKHR